MDSDIVDPIQPWGRVIPANMRLRLFYCPRRWTNSKPTLDRRLVAAGKYKTSISPELSH